MSSMEALLAAAAAAPKAEEDSDQARQTSQTIAPHTTIADPYDDEEEDGLDPALLDPAPHPEELDHDAAAPPSSRPHHHHHHHHHRSHDHDHHHHEQPDDDYHDSDPTADQDSELDRGSSASKRSKRDSRSGRDKYCCWVYCSRHGKSNTMGTMTLSSSEKETVRAARLRVRRAILLGPASWHEDSPRFKEIMQSRALSYCKVHVRDPSESFQGRAAANLTADKFWPREQDPVFTGQEPGRRDDVARRFERTLRRSRTGFRDGTAAATAAAAEAEFTAAATIRNGGVTPAIERSGAAMAQRNGLVNGRNGVTAVGEGGGGGGGGGAGGGGGVGVTPSDSQSTSETGGVEAAVAAVAKVMAGLRPASDVPTSPTTAGQFPTDAAAAPSSAQSNSRKRASSSSSGELSGSRSHRLQSVADSGGPTSNTKTASSNSGRLGDFALPSPASSVTGIDTSAAVAAAAAAAAAAHHNLVEHSNGSTGSALSHTIVGLNSYPPAYGGALQGVVNKALSSTPPDPNLMSAIEPSEAMLRTAYPLLWSEPLLHARDHHRLQLAFAQLQLQNAGSQLHLRQCLERVGTLEMLWQSLAPGYNNAAAVAAAAAAAAAATAVSDVTATGPAPSPAKRASIVGGLTSPGVGGPSASAAATAAAVAAAAQHQQFLSHHLAAMNSAGSTSAYQQRFPWNI